MEIIGKKKRIKKFFHKESGKTLIVPLDDSLLAGPTNGLVDLKSKAEKIISAKPNAIIGFKGLFKNFSDIIGDLPAILNITGSTTKGMHTKKVLVDSVETGVKLGIEAVAVHVNISSKYESEMLKILGKVSRECEKYGMPLLAIMYPRRENEDGTDNNYLDLKNNNIKQYTYLVAHAARVGLELGADLIKTQYTGDPESFSVVVESCSPIPVIAAGGPPLNIDIMLSNAKGIIQAGGAGVSFGRNVFTRENPEPYIIALKEIIHNDKSVDDAIYIFNNWK